VPLVIELPNSFRHGKPNRLDGGTVAGLIPQFMQEVLDRDLPSRQWNHELSEISRVEIGRLPQMRA
jgi:hypothetical protein